MSDIAVSRPAKQMSIGAWVGLGAALACSLFVFMQMRPDLLLSNNTPAGGDMGAHVWGPAYMRDNLLSQGRLVGWTPDWYAGFPAYHFYMVVPALAVIAVNAGLHPIIGIPLAIVALIVGWIFSQRYSEYKPLVWSAAAMAAVLLVSVPYGVAFKLVAVSGVVFFPLAAWMLGRMAGSPEPVPGVLAFAAVIFLFDPNFTIYGGNVPSTLAGEFAFSISLCLVLVALALVFRGMDNDKGRASAAAVISLVALCHVIPLIFAIVALMVVVFLGKEIPRWWTAAIGAGLALLAVSVADQYSTSVRIGAVVALIAVAAAGLYASRAIRERSLWLMVVGPCAALISAFWLVPFYLRRDYFNDMGWERLDEVGDALLTTPMRIALPIAAVSAVLAFASRDRVGMLFTVMGVSSAAAVANLGQGKLWNARLLPFFYLSVYLLAAVGLGLVVRFAAIAISENFDAPDLRMTIGSVSVGLAALLISLSVPLRNLPFAETTDEGAYSILGFETDAKSFVPSWVEWNFSGYENKRSYREYSSVVTTMASVGESEGCGRAMWEYDRSLDRYGTPMALMLLPHWTDGCISSMEGLYFESSASTPFHFLNQSLLSENPSRAQRDLPYRGFNLDAGIAQLQTTGVRYYMAQSDMAIEEAREHESLREVAESQPFVIFQVAGTELVQGLSVEPIVTSGPTREQMGPLATRFEIGWESQAVEAYNSSLSWQALPAEDGPDGWQRLSVLKPTDGVEIEPATVTSIETSNSKINFTVDEIGKPILIKTSYFPNWDASGAEGPFRVGPNLMAVVPTSTEVELSYGYTGVEYLAYLLTFAGLLGLGLMSWAERRRSDFVFGAVPGEPNRVDPAATLDPLQTADSVPPVDALPKLVPLKTQDPAPATEDQFTTKAPGSDDGRISDGSPQLSSPEVSYQEFPDREFPE